MQQYTTIIGVIQMRLNDCSFSVIQGRYHIGSGTTQRIWSRFEASGLTLEELRTMEPKALEELFYPSDQIRRKDIPLPDFQYYYDRDCISASGCQVVEPIQGQHICRCMLEQDDGQSVSLGVQWP